ncbi:signal-regulatory protein beta-1 [Xenopus laevis]|uniref:Signal-regulatory protein beta-1 n=1 Tax=Xenopus laevis TaxID=8355 RepID=A0A8J1LQL9_XENLA|nr:signal-regulatory protein beta-1 [Xenopus laevis]
MGMGEAGHLPVQFLRILGILCLLLLHQTGAGLEVNVPFKLIFSKGSDILIPCTFHVNKFPADPKLLAIEWDLYGRRILTYDNGVSTMDPRFSLKSNSATRGEASLSVSNTQVSDGGRYTCTVTYGTEWQEKEIILEIQAPPQITITNKVVSENKESVLRASITGFYPQDLDVKWLRDGEILPGVTVNKSQRDPDGTHSTTSTVTIVPTKENRNQIFSIRLQHESLTVPLQKDFQLIYGVPAPPSMVITHQLFYENQEQTLKCQVWGYYPESIAVSWLMNGSRVEASEIKRINSSALESSYRFLPTAESQGMEISCVVEHQALTQPLVETLKVQLTESDPVSLFVILSAAFIIFIVIGSAALFLYIMKKNKSYIHSLCISKRRADNEQHGASVPIKLNKTMNIISKKISCVDEKRLSNREESVMEKLRSPRTEFIGEI